MNDNDLQLELIALLEANLGLPAGSIAVDSGTRLLGVVPELDSMSVVNILISLEEKYGIVIHDDEVEAETMETLGNLTAFLHSKVS